MTWWQNLILSIIEGLTEYLPVSSTGHMMMAGEVMHLNLADIDTYIISVQFGAILAVVAIYWRKFLNLKDYDFYLKLLVGFIPAAILGKLLDEYLEQLLQTPVIVGITLIVIGLFLLVIHRILPGGTKETKDISYLDALVIGAAQCVAMIPGVSRSAASISGGLGRGLSRVAATEFSFFLAVPTLSAAGIYKLYKNWDVLSQGQVQDIAIGNIMSFFTAILAIRFFIGLVKKKGFAWFGVYRIVVGILFLGFLFLR
ncbi:MAG: undecaprenyl-diphosphate phosphatase [Bacteroidetes bacterium]|nr:undecaprenyl-diphosphate phosphatase [Bacteroidota bacterium]